MSFSLLPHEHISLLTVVFKIRHFILKSTTTVCIREVDTLKILLEVLKRTKPANNKDVCRDLESH